MILLHRISGQSPWFCLCMIHLPAVLRGCVQFRRGGAAAEGGGGGGGGGAGTLELPSVRAAFSFMRIQANGFCDSLLVLGGCA